MDKFVTDVEFVIAREALKRDAEKAKQEIAGIGDTAEKVAERVEAEILEVSREQERLGSSSAASFQKQKTALDAVSNSYKEMLEDAIQVYGELSPRTQRYLQQLNQLDKESRDLAAAQGQLSTAFEKGDLTQRQYADASRALVIQQTRVERKIGEINGELQRNNAVESAAVGSIARKTAKLTQLRAQYERLSDAQRNHVQVGGKIREEYQRLTKEVDDLNSSLTGTKSEGIGKVFASVRGIAGTLGIAFGVQQLVSFGRELFEIAKQAEGVELAFARMGDTKALDRLREATKNTVSDLELMKLAVRADNFRIPMDVLAKGLEFAKRRATDTGQEVDYMVNSFVDGLGRKSTLVLDNLGISLVEIQEEVKKVGDFNIAVGNIITREMAKAGDSVDMLADKSGRLATIWENLKKELSRAFGRGLDADNIQRRTEFLQVPRLRLFDGATQEERDAIIADLREMKRQADDALKLKTEEYNSANAFLVDINAIEKQYGKSLKNIRADLQAQKEAAMEESQAINNALNNLLKKNEEIAVQERQGKGIFSIEELRQKISDLTSARDKLTDATKVAEMNKEIDALTEKLQKLSGSERKKEASASEKAADVETKARKKLIDQWVAMDADYLAKAMTKNEQEVQSVRNKYADFRKVAEEFNAKAKGEKISLDGLDESEQAAIEAIRYRQRTEALTTELQKHRELWEQYEDFKTATSAAHADERYADDLGKIKSFRSELEKQISDLTMKSITVGLTGGEEERLKALDTFLRSVEDKEQADRDARFKKAFTDYATFEQKRQKIVADAEADISALTAKGELERADERRKVRDKDLADLTEAYLKSQGDIKTLFEDFEKFGARGQLRLIDAAKRAFEQFKKETKLGAGELEILNKLFDEYLGKLERAAQGDFMGGIIGLSQELQGIVTQIGRMDQGLGQALQTIGQMAQSYIKISDIVAQIGDSVQGAGESSGNVWVAAIGAIVELVGTIWSAIAEGRKRRRAAEKAAQEDLANYQAQEIAGEREYQRLLRQRELIAAQAGKTSYRALVDQLEVLKAQTPEIEAAYNRIFAALQGDEFIDGKGYKHGTWFRKAKTWDVMASLAGSDYERLEQLYLQGKLKDTAKADFEALQSLREELEGLGLDVQDLQRQLAELLTGTTAEGLADGLTQLFQNGKMAAADFGKSFEEIMRNAITQTFKQTYLMDAMQPLYEELAELMSKGTPTDAEIARLRKLYEDVGLEASEYWKEVEKITGQKLTTGDGTNTGIAGRINRTIEESTASEILGFERARYDLAKRDLMVSEESIRVEKQLYDATLQSLRHQAAIEQNTADTVTELRTAVVELKAINKNTKQTSTSYDRP